MDTLLKQMQERLKNLESQEQTDEIKARRSELCLIILDIQQAVLREMSNKNDVCICSYPTDASNGTQRCVTCNKKLSLKSLIEIAARPSINLNNRTGTKTIEYLKASDAVYYGKHNKLI